MKFCSKCGNKNQEDAKYCVSCGNEFFAVTQDKSSFPESKVNKMKNNSEKELYFKSIKRLLPFVIGIIVVIVSLQLYSQHKTKVEEERKQAAIEQKQIKEEEEKEKLLDDAENQAQYKVNEIQEVYDGIAVVSYDRERQTIEVATEFELKDSSEASDSEIIKVLNPFVEDSRELRDKVKDYTYNLEVYWKGNPSEKYFIIVNGEAMGGSLIGPLMASSANDILNNNDSSTSNDIDSDVSANENLTENEIKLLDKFNGSWKGESIETGEHTSTPGPSISYEKGSNVISIGYMFEPYSDSYIQKVTEVSEDIVEIEVAHDNFANGSALIKLERNQNNSIVFNIDEGNGYGSNIVLYSR